MTTDVADSTFARSLRMLRDLPPGERLEAIAYGLCVQLAEDPRADFPGGLEQLLADLHGRVRHLQAEAFE